MIDVTGIENVKTGDEVILIGSSGNKEITVDEIANQAYTIRDEIIANISKRVPRVYLRNNSIVKVINSSMY
jgi:alanine racemase